MTEARRSIEEYTEEVLEGMAGQLGGGWRLEPIPSYDISFPLIVLTGNEADALISRINDLEEEVEDLKEKNTNLQIHGPEDES